MSNLSIMKLRALRARFNGRITDEHPAHAEFTGRPPVLIPETPVDVVRALTLASTAGRPVYLRSGARVTRADLISNPDVAVVSLEAFTEVHVALERVSVGPAATVGDVATKLRHRALFLPLPDQPTVSMAAAVIGAHRAPFPRSAADPSLAEGVVEADIVRADAGRAGEIETLDADGWRKFRSVDNGGIVTRIVLDASKWAEFGKNRWVCVWMVPYTRNAFQTLSEFLFRRPAPDRADLGLRASIGGYGAQLVVIRATGQGPSLSEEVRSFVERALNEARCTVLWWDQVNGAGAALAAWVGAGPGSAGSDEVNEIVATDGEWSEAGEEYFSAVVSDLIGKDAWINLQLQPSGLVRRTVVKTYPDVADFSVSSASSTRPYSDFLQPLSFKPPPPRTRVALPPTGPLASITSTHQGGPIPDFTGDVFDRDVNDRDYKNAQMQYASSSIDEATKARRMTPRFLAVPRDAKDVVRAVAWAADQRLKVVTRAGGHQYCGLSSGGEDTLLIDVKLLDPEPEFSANGTRVTVGPGVSLKRLTAKLFANNASIPHGECPLVKLGGHVQTGGIGHQIRTLGVALDWVREFKLVGWDGADGGWKERVYELPLAEPQSPKGEVFAAVLGGGPGSWGVLTEITFEVRKDQNLHNPSSVGHTRAYPYNRAAWAEAFKQLCDWSKKEHDNELPDDVDFFLSVVSDNNDLLPNGTLRPSVLLVEMTALEAKRERLILSVIDKVKENVSWVDRGIGSVIDLTQGNLAGLAHLSSIVHHGVRKTGSLGGMPDGREFLLPYKKSVYVTRDPVPVGFRRGFVDIVDRVERNPHTKVVFQGVLGGGKFLEHGVRGTTRMQHRDALMQLVFDVFYQPGHVDVAECFQKEMLELWNEHFPRESGRMFWGTYEDASTEGTQLDMSRPDTRDRYYDSPAVYTALQKVKARVDPTDVFHTSFTVQLPKP